MITLIRYAFSVLIWGAVAVALLLTGKIVYLTFWTIIGAGLILFWLGHMLYHICCLFDPDFKPIRIVIFMLLLVAGGLTLFKTVVEPRWNSWGSTREEIEARYEVDRYCDGAELRTVRTVEVNAPREYIFKWARQLPEMGSYGSGFFGFDDEKYEKLLENLPDLKEGDEFLIGKITDFKDGKSITFDIGSDPKFPKMGINCMYGGYYFRDIGDDKTRIIMVMRADYDGIMGWFYSQVIVEIGDFFISTRQIDSLKDAAERKFAGPR